MTPSIIGSAHKAPQTGKGYKGLAMEGVIARWYARNTGQRGFDVLAQRVSKIVPAGGRVLEVAPGPGFLSIEIAKIGEYKVTGLEISKTFVEIERENAKQAGVEVDFRQGDAAYLPFEDASFDFVVCTAAFKNFTRPAQALAEMNRVLRPNGKALVVDLCKDASTDEINREVDGMGLNRLNAAFTKLAFSTMLLGRAYTQAQIKQFLADAGVPKSRVDVGGIGFEIWIEK
ncbi:MAG: class I SAM-dependent methyltransferase [Chloroflexi bacterium]|nr:class I SAM-dependent methyltransferase [Chloroflexota bacterium]